MNKITPKSNSIFKLKANFSFSKYSRQTIQCLFRSLLETVLEADDSSLILYKVQNNKEFEGLLKRLEFSDINSFSYCDEDINEDFLLAISDRFSFALVWDNQNIDFSDAIVSINHQQVSSIIELLQNNHFNRELDNLYSQMRYDRRENKLFKNILTKLIASFEELQKDYMCQDTISSEQTYQKFDLMASKISHEGRNYLGLIDLHSSLIYKKLTMNKFDIESLMKSSSVISKSIDNLDNLFNNLKFYEGSFDIQKTDNNLNQLLKEVGELFSINLKRLNTKLNIKSKENINFNFDYSAIKQVLINIIKNALEATGENGIIEIETKKSDGIEIFIKDNAKGISEEIKDNIFELNVSTKRRGSGIGLNLSKELIEKHDGSIEIYETSQKGTTFLIKLPK